MNDECSTNPKEYKPNCELLKGMSLPDGVHRYGLILEYNGTLYQGFQKQNNTSETIQIYLERALSTVADRAVTVICAGRTDSGVHASRQVVHFDVDVERPEKAWVQGVNTKLPNDIRIHYARKVPGGFHARFSAVSRTYRYALYSSQVRPATIGNFVTWTKYQFDVQRMSDAAQCLVGEHDFSSFRASQCQSKSPFREVEYIKFIKSGSFIIMEIKANAFLHHMVRNIVGSLIDVGRGAKPVEWIEQVLSQRNRCSGAATAAPTGLYLVGVDYPVSFQFPSHAYGPDFLEPLWMTVGS